MCGAEAGHVIREQATVPPYHVPNTYFLKALDIRHLVRRYRTDPMCLFGVVEFCHMKGYSIRRRGTAPPEP